MTAPAHRAPRRDPGPVPLAAALVLSASFGAALWLSVADPPDRPAPARMVEHADVMPCRGVTGGRCEMRRDLVYRPPAGPAR